MIITLSKPTKANLVGITLSKPTKANLVGIVNRLKGKCLKYVV